MKVTPAVVWSIKLLTPIDQPYSHVLILHMKEYSDYIFTTLL